jgi:aspartyl-tRNA(Asn)/glutamyl-tRNA(Gln) amidotransferase subunit C
LLADVELTEEEKNLFTKQFNEILEYFKKIDKANIEDVPPTYHVFDLKNVFRKDETKGSLSQEEVLGNTTNKEKGFFKAPKIV